MYFQNHMLMMMMSTIIVLKMKGHRTLYVTCRTVWNCIRQRRILCSCVMMFLAPCSELAAVTCSRQTAAAFVRTVRL